MNNIERGNQISRLREEIIRLGPWHLDVRVTPEISTRVFLEAPAGTYSSSFGDVSFISPQESFRNLLKNLLKKSTPAVWRGRPSWIAPAIAGLTASGPRNSARGAASASTCASTG
jgi:hypothetical protein